MKNSVILALMVSLTAVTSCACAGDSDAEDTARHISAVQPEPRRLNVRVKEVLPHSRKTYTQGLEFHDGKLYESSGEYGLSFIEILSFPDLKTVKRTEVDDRFFAEGITVLNDTLYMLTWREHQVLLFDPATLDEIGRHTVYTEGWGITNDGHKLYMSDGSQYIYEIDPATFERKRRIAVTTPAGPVFNINELEWIDGRIWANVYGYNNMLIVDPATGYVEAIVECDGLLEPEDIKRSTDVLNGIAYDPESKKIYVTGKRWPKMFEIELFR